MTSKTTQREVQNYGLVGPTIHGIKWFGTPEGLADAFADYPNAKIRLLVNDEVTFGMADEVQPIYDALNAVRDSTRA